MNAGTELGRRVFHYRMAGDSINDIADRLGITTRIAHRVFSQYAMQVARDGDSEDRKVAVELEVARLDALMNCYWLEATQGQDKAAAKLVLDTINVRAKIQGLDKADATDPAVMQHILVVGQNQADFIRALESGRKSLGSGAPENEIVQGTVEEELQA